MKGLTAYALVGLALADRAGSDPGRSARLHGAADQALAKLGHTFEPMEVRLTGQDRQRLRGRSLGRARRPGVAPGPIGPSATAGSIWPVRAKRPRRSAGYY